MKISDKKINPILINIIFFIIFRCQICSSENHSNKVCIWEVKSKTNLCYLLGSIHLLEEENYPLDPVFEKVFNRADILIFEVNLDQVSNLENQSLISRKAKLKSGESIKTWLSEDSYQLLKSEIQSMGLNLNTLEYYKPWYIAIMIGQFKLYEMGFKPQFGIDLYFYHKAKSRNKAVYGLETASFQTELLNQMDAKTQEMLLLQTLEDFMVIKKDLHQIIIAWETGNSHLLEKILLESFHEYPQIYKQLIIKRNQDWLKKIKLYLGKNKNVLIVVGTGHLIGNYGLVNLLKKDGFSVVQLEEQ